MSGIEQEILKKVMQWLILADLDVNNLTPIEAINLLNQIKEEMNES